MAKFNPVICVVGLFGETIVAPEFVVHSTVSPAYKGVFPCKIVEVIELSQKDCVLLVPPACVTSCVAAGTVILTVSEPTAHGP